MDFQKLLPQLAAHYQGALVPHPLQSQVSILQLHTPRQFRIFLSQHFPLKQPSQVWILFPVIPITQENTHLRSLLKNRSGSSFVWRVKRKLLISGQTQNHFCLNSLSSMTFEDTVFQIDTLINEAQTVLSVIEDTNNWRVIKKKLKLSKDKKLARLLELTG